MKIGRIVRSRRQQRIDRALSHVLDAIEVLHNEKREACGSWRDLNILSAEMDKLRIAAYDKADALTEKWERRIVCDD